MSEKTPREYILVKSAISNQALIYELHEEMPIDLIGIRVREVIEPDTSCESKMDAAVQMLTEKNAEITRLKAENDDLANKVSYMSANDIKNATERLSEVQSRDAEIAELKETLSVAKDALKYLSDTDAWALGKPSASFAHQTLTRIQSILGEKEGADENG